MLQKVVVGGTATFFVVFAGIVWGWSGAEAAIGFILLGLLAWFVNQYLWVRVPEMEVWLKFNIESKAFAGYLPPGRHWLVPWERVRGKLSTQAQTVRGKCLQTQTQGGITAHVDWSVTYMLNPQTISWDFWPHMARILPQHSDQIIRSHGNNCIALVISELPVSVLADKGGRGRLERMIREQLVKRLHPFGVQIFQVMVTGVELPSHVQDALEKAHEREVYAYSEAAALERLQQAISQFSDADMERLLLLKQVHEMGQNGVALYVPSIMPMFQNGSRTTINGETRDGRKPSPPPSALSGVEGGHHDWSPPAH
jgi:regulator of protease activity HflC (stomatin/prohibitin superfamily)